MSLSWLPRPPIGFDSVTTSSPPPTPHTQTHGANVHASYAPNAVETAENSSGTRDRPRSRFHSSEPGVCALFTTAADQDSEQQPLNQRHAPVPTPTLLLQSRNNVCPPATAPLSVSSSSLKHDRSEHSGSQADKSQTPLKRTCTNARSRDFSTSQPFHESASTSTTSKSSRVPRTNVYRNRVEMPFTHSTNAIMNKSREELSGMTTLKLARGSISNTSPPRAGSVPGWTAVETRNNMPKSPDSRNSKSISSQILGSVGVIEFLELDERPTFIIDLANTANYTPGSSLQLIFANAALRAHENILENVTGKADLNSPGIAVTNDFPEFKAWALSFVRNYESLDISLPQFQFGGITWTCSTLRKRLRLISGTSNNITATTASSSSIGAGSASSAFMDKVKASQGVPSSSPLIQYEPMDYFGEMDQESSTTQSTPQCSTAQDIGTENAKQLELPLQAMRATPENVLSTKNLKTRYSEAASFDWTRLPMSAALPRHIQFCKSIDWASTPLGPMESWSFDLRAMCNLIMGSPHPAAMYWGDEKVTIYNEAYILLAGHKHPKLMGMRYEDAWREIWPEIEEVFLNAQYAGQATMKDDDCLFVNRNGFLEEAYFSWSIIPLIGEDGTVVGTYNPAFDKTRRKIAERRMLTLREVGERTATARELKGFWGQVIKGLEYNEYDVPFCFLYSVADDTDSDMGSMHSGSLSQAPQLTLEGTLGVPSGHDAAVSPLDLRTSEEGFAPYFREAMKQNRPVLVTVDDGTLSAELIEGFEWRGFGDPCRAAIICPIHPTTGDTILGFLVVGINPRRPYDDDYSLFVQLLSRQLATSMASVVLFEEEIRRGQRAAQLAALDRQELSKQLDLRTQEAEESETKFTRMAEFAPIGLFIADSEGAITYSNDTWWEISRHPRSRHDSANTWMESIKDEDREGVQKLWRTLVHEKTAITHEFRFKTPWQDNNGNRGSTWVLMSAFPEVADGQLKSVFGSITNISQTKWVEGFQKRRMEEAIELKRQQENFIDMTSHEMRNPLSAILQCSDEITSSLTEYRTTESISNISEKLNELLESSIDASQTIALCAQHQKRIVDDILTLSKLDSALLVVTPVAVQPIAVVQRALKMFEGELDSNDIAMEFRMERSYLELGVDWVKLDPSRLLQVLINLTTNAIKFTHGQDKRTIIVNIGASKTQPGSYHSDIAYFTSRSKQEDTTRGPDWGDGEEIFLHFAVQDTGRGLDENEKALLFQRFSQASPRTHVQYGGSGLGLFISRQLSELQGGQIGVSSERGVGSTFAFYVRARRVAGIPQDTPIASAINALRHDSTLTSIVVESRQNSAGKPTSRSSASGRSGRRSSAVAPTPSPQATPPLPKPKLDPTQLRVLIVEDNLVNQRVLQKQLKHLGFPTVVANHGGEALEILKTSKFWSGKEIDGEELTVILMDLEMPIMDGLSCSREIRRLQANGTIVRHVPIIAVTANARMEQIETAMAAGMDDVVSKPFRIPELIPKIEELVTKAPTPTVPPLPTVPILDSIGNSAIKARSSHLSAPPILPPKAASSPSVMKSVAEEPPASPSKSSKHQGRLG